MGVSFAWLFLNIIAKNEELTNTGFLITCNSGYLV